MTAPDPFLGRWNFNVQTPVGQRGAWLAVVDREGEHEVWHQPTGGHVVRLADAAFSGPRLTFVSPGSARRPAAVWDLEARGDMLIGVQRHDGWSVPLLGMRAPDLRRDPPAAWSAPIPLFDGRTLDGWIPVGERSEWIARDGLLVNQAAGANLRSARVFDDFVLHFEVRGEAGTNSGFYLRGRYEVQIEFEPLTRNPPERRIGSIYGRIAPMPELPRRPGEWHRFDVTLVGRTVTIAHDGVTTVNEREIDGITGGALDADEGAPGPFYVQGDHTGGLAYRHITVAVPLPQAAPRDV
ncbi:MAG: DUF1080 domain-containing protein [Acidobacteria bacterium]|nr:DUF1080 domain-containing protein [Acidobacteriota bacterium]